jgi:hypothetical protein
VKARVPIDFVQPLVQGPVSLVGDQHSIRNSQHDAFVTSFHIFNEDAIQRSRGIVRIAPVAPQLFL